MYFGLDGLEAIPLDGGAEALQLLCQLDYSVLPLKMSWEGLRRGGGTSSEGKGYTRRQRGRREARRGCAASRAGLWR